MVADNPAPKKNNFACFRKSFDHALTCLTRDTRAIVCGLNCAHTILSFILGPFEQKSCLSLLVCPVIT
jgi:hypothetical protein